MRGPRARGRAGAGSATRGAARPPHAPPPTRPGPDGCEIGYTWLAASAMRTAANTEAKLLMLTHAFEEWGVQRVCFHTDVRNERSRAALSRIGARFEGVLRAHRLGADLTARDSARFSVVATEWPAVKQRLRERLARAWSCVAGAAKRHECVA